MAVTELTYYRNENKNRSENPEPYPARLRYSLEGAQAGELVVALGGISADCQIVQRDDGTQGWWGWLIGPGKAIDTGKCRVLSFDYQATKLLSVHDPSFTTTEEQADALKALLDELGFAKISTFIGASYGGMVALAFAVKYPERVERLVVISAAHRNSPFSTALRTVQRKIVQIGRDDTAKESLSLARSLAMLTYRTDTEIDAKFSDSDRFDDPEDSTVWKYLKYNGDKYAERTNAFRFLNLSRSIDHHTIDPSKIKTPLVVATCNQDLLVPIEICQELVKGAKCSARLIRFDSIYGHDAFLKEETHIAKILNQIMETK